VVYTVRSFLIIPIPMVASLSTKMEADERRRKEGIGMIAIVMGVVIIIVVVRVVIITGTTVAMPSATFAPSLAAMPAVNPLNQAIRYGGRATTQGAQSARRKRVCGARLRKDHEAANSCGSKQVLEVAHDAPPFSEKPLSPVI
jgi:hypothetical protein